MFRAAAGIAVAVVEAAGTCEDNRFLRALVSPASFFLPAAPAAAVAAAPAAFAPGRAEFWESRLPLLEAADVSSCAAAVTVVDAAVGAFFTTDTFSEHAPAANDASPRTATFAAVSVDTVGVDAVGVDPVGIGFVEGASTSWQALPRDLPASCFHPRVSSTASCSPFTTFPTLPFPPLSRRCAGKSLPLLPAAPIRYCVGILQSVAALTTAACSPSSRPARRLTRLTGPSVLGLIVLLQALTAVLAAELYPPKDFLVSGAAGVKLSYQRREPHCDSADSAVLVRLTSLLSQWRRGCSCSLLIAAFTEGGRDLPVVISRPEIPPKLPTLVELEGLRLPVRSLASRPLLLCALLFVVVFSPLPNRRDDLRLFVEAGKVKAHEGYCGCSTNFPERCCREGALRFSIALGCRPAQGGWLTGLGHCVTGSCWWFYTAVLCIDLNLSDGVYSHGRRCQCRKT